MFLIILSIGTTAQRKHTQDGINAGILAAHAQSPSLTRAIRSVHDGSNNQFTGVPGERVRRQRLSRRVESDPGYQGLSSNRERLRYARQLARKKNDSSHGNKSGKEPSKSKHTPSPSETAGTTPFPTTMGGDKSGKKHHIINTPAPSQSKDTLFPTKAEKQYQRRQRNQHQLQAIARHQKSLLRVSSLKLLLRMLKTQASVSTTTRKIRRKMTRLH